MQSKKWALWCAFVGIIGGAFLMVSPLGLIAAGIGAKGSVINSILLLMLCAYLAISFVGVKSKLYYKGDDRVSTFVANTFVVAGVIGCFPIFLEILPRIPILYELFYWLFSFVFFWTGSLFSHFSINRICGSSIDCEWHWICGLLEKLQRMMVEYRV